MSNNCTARNDLLVALHTLASHFENALYAFGDDDEARKKAEGDIAWARLVASRHNYNGSECKEIERLRELLEQAREFLPDEVISVEHRRETDYADHLADRIDALLKRVHEAQGNE